MKYKSSQSSAQSGRISVVAAIAVVCVLASLGVVMFSGENKGPETTANGFMSALAETDAKKLASFSYLDGQEEAAVQAKWEENLKRTRYFQFRWAFDGIETSSQETVIARINLKVAGDNDPTLHRIPLLKVKDAWKVDVAAINRSFYPALPR